MYFRLSIDDNIWFLRDIARMCPASIFDHAYLNELKSLHIKYGIKIHLNLFYETDSFCLTQFPDCYRSEWIENSDWLRLSFHAREEHPDFPYAHTEKQVISRDCRMLQEEIIRFAGEETLSHFTTIHYCQATQESVMELRKCGMLGLVGLFGTAKDPQQSYHLSKEAINQLLESNYYFDSETDLSFFNINFVLNNFPLDEIEDQLKPFLKRELVEIMIHEQYFYKSYPAYQADFIQKLERAVSFLQKYGFESIFLEECYNLTMGKKNRL